MSIQEKLFLLAFLFFGISNVKVQAQTLKDTDNNTYTTITIGTQLWLKENLKTTRYNDGKRIQLLADSTKWYNSTNPAYCWYTNEDNSVIKTYGALYNWDAVNTAILCPVGWHVPSVSEFTELTDFLGGDILAGSKLKESGKDYWESTPPGTTNESGFTALPGGLRDFWGPFESIGLSGYWWLSDPDEKGESRPACVWIDGNNGRVYISNNYYRNGFSVRCLSDVKVKLSTLNVTTSAITNIDSTGAASGGNVSLNGEADIFARGMCWSLNENPTISDCRTNDGSGPGTFSSAIKGLEKGRKYYVRAYAIQGSGAVYGNEISFCTFSKGLTVADADGYNYLSVEIGKQVWMVENLKTTKYNNGDIIETTIPATLDLKDETAPKYQWAYNGNEALVSGYGRLYTWFAATDERGICPPGWHVPDDAEWTELTDFLGGAKIAGGKLKKSGTEHWSIFNTEATNSSGFAALPGGFRNYFGVFRSNGVQAAWRSTTEYGTESVWGRILSYDNGELFRLDVGMKGGFAVRCIKN